MGDNPDIRMSAALVKDALASANITLAKSAGAWTEYDKAVAAGSVTAIDGFVAPKSASAIDAVYRYVFSHWGIGAWACYALVGIALAFFAYSRNLPLTIRSTLMPLLGRSLEGTLGHVVDITAVVATISGIAQTIGLGLSSFGAGLHNITGAAWLMTDKNPSTGALLLALTIVMVCSTASALSGVGKGIKWLSNINMCCLLVYWHSSRFSAQQCLWRS